MSVTSIARKKDAEKTLAFTTPSGAVYSFETITPDVAQEMLSHNLDNRRARRPVVDGYGRDISAGKWRENGAAEAELLNRLAAPIWDAGKPTVTLPDDFVRSEKRHPPKLVAGLDSVRQPRTILGRLQRLGGHLTSAKRRSLPGTSSDLSRPGPRTA